MEAAHGSPSVLMLARDPEHLARLEEANKLLEEIQKVHQSSGQPSATPVHVHVGTGICAPHMLAAVPQVVLDAANKIQGQTDVRLHLLTSRDASKD